MSQAFLRTAPCLLQAEPLRDLVHQAFQLDATPLLRLQRLLGCDLRSREYWEQPSGLAVLLVLFWVVCSQVVSLGDGGKCLPVFCLGLTNTFKFLH